MMGTVVRFRVDEVDDTTPTLVTFGLVDASKARAMADSFKGSGCLVVCDGKTYRPFLVQQTKPGWWQVSATLVNIPG